MLNCFLTSHKWIKTTATFLALTFAVGLLLLPAACGSQSAQPGNTAAPTPITVVKKNVLVLYAYQSDLISSILSTNAIREVFSQAPDLQIDLYFEYLDLGRFSDQAYQDRLIALLNKKYMQKSVDLVIVANQLMIQWWPENRAKILPQTGVVFFDVDNQNLTGLHLPPDFTGVGGFVDYIQSVKWYMGFRPTVNEIVIVHGMGPVDLSQINYLPVELLKQEFSGKMQVTDLSNLPLAEIKKRVAVLPQTSVLVYHPMFEDAEGISQRPINVLRELNAVSPVPVIGAFDQFVGEGIVGGYLYSIDRQARDAVGIAVRILRGEKPSDIPISINRSNAFIFDHLALRRYDIPLSALPTDAIIKNHQYSFWELYQTQIIAAAVIGIVLLVLVVYLILFSTRLVRARLALTNLNSNLETQVEERTTDLQKTNFNLGEEITERKQVEAALRESEGRLKEVLDNSLDVSYKRDLETNAYEYLSPVFARISGYTPEEMRTLPIDTVLNLIHPQDKAEVDRVIQASMSGESGASYWVEYRFKHKDGRYLWFHDQFTILKDGADQPLAMIGSLSDVTERKNIELALKANEKNFRSLVENTLDGILIASAEGWYVYANQNAARLLGYSVTELLEQVALTETAAPESFPQMKQRLEDRIAGRPVSPIFETILQRKDGTCFSAEVIGTPTEWQGQACDLVFFRDITERKRSETELRRYAQNTSTLYELSQQIHTSLDLNNIYEKTHQAIRMLMACDAFLISLLDNTGQAIEDTYCWDKDRRFPGQKHPRGTGLSDYIISSGITMCVNEWNDDHTRLTGSELFGYTEEDKKSVLGVPLFRTNGTCFGMISVQSYLSNQYSGEDEQLLGTLANQVSKAIENAQLYAQVQENAITDGLTGVANRRGLFQSGEHEIQRAIRFQHPLTAIMLDIDHFKFVNDTYGHPIGDRILGILAKCCQTLVRNVDIVTRYGGDEFVLLLTETDLESAAGVAERLRHAVEQTDFSVESDESIIGRSIHVTISLGVMGIRQDSDSIKNLIMRADQALYAAKSAGRNQIKVG